MSDDRPADKDLPNSDEYFISTRQSYSDENCHRDESSPDSELVHLHDGKHQSYLQRVASDPVMYPRDHILQQNIDEDDDDDDDDDDSKDREDSFVFTVFKNTII